MVIIFLLNSFFNFCQSDSIKNGNELIFVVESMPEFKGDIISFINHNLKYPESALQDSIKGRVYVSFWVDIDGKTSEHEIIRGIREDVDQEALRIAKLITFEKPAMQKGKPVRVKYTIPINFCYSELEKSPYCKKRKKGKP